MINLQDIYARIREGSGQRWLMIDLEDKGALYDDIFRLIEIRRGKFGKPEERASQRLSLIHI